MTLTTSQDNAFRKGELLADRTKTFTESHGESSCTLERREYLYRGAFYTFDFFWRGERPSKKVNPDAQYWPSDEGELRQRLKRYATREEESRLASQKRDALRRAQEQASGLRDSEGIRFEFYDDNALGTADARVSLELNHSMTVAQAHAILKILKGES